MSVSICSPDYGNKLKDFALLTIVDKISKKILVCAPVDSDGDGKINIRIEHKASSAAVPTQITAYTLFNNIVSFTAALNATGDYSISYSCNALIISYSCNAAN